MDTDTDQEHVVESKEVCPIEYVCEVCGSYPLIPVHGHFECTECHYKTKCCEGI